MKTLAVSLATAAFVFSGLSSDPHWLIGVGGCIPVLACWILDARYLHLERAYIKLYDAILNGTQTTPFNLNYRPYVGEIDPVWRVAMSWSVLRFYGALLIMVISLVVMLVLRDVSCV